MQVDKKMFENMQRSFPFLMLLHHIKEIQKNFGIDWLSVEWKDLRRPLYSALGARLYILYRSRMYSDDIPRSIEDQATFWYTHYRPYWYGDQQHFNRLAIEYENREYKSMITERDGPNVTLCDALLFSQTSQVTTCFMYKIITLLN